MKKLLLLLLFPLSLFGQGTKISDMTSATSLTGAEYVPIVQTTNKKATVSLLRGWSSIGTASQLLRVNAGATALEFFTPTWLTNPLTTTGDIIYSSSGTTGARLGIGSAGSFLRSDGSIPAWSTLTIPNTISALSIPVVNTANVLTSVTPSAGQSVRINAGGTAWEAFTPGSGGGSDTQVQFNDAGSFGGDAGFVYNKTTNVGTIGGLNVSGLTASELVATDGSKNLQSLAVATYPSLTELSYVKGLTSAVQTQLADKWSLASGGTLTGANTITGSTTNTLKAVFNSLSTSAPDGAGLWLSNTTASTNGATQISPNITLEGTGWSTGSGASHSSKIKIYNVTSTGSTNHISSFYVSLSKNGGAYAPLFTVNSNQFNTVTATIGDGSAATTLAVGAVSGLSSLGITKTNPANATTALTVSSTYGSVSGVSIANGGTSFTASSGAFTYAGFLHNGTIDQSGTASGILRSFASSPVLTSIIADKYIAYDHSPSGAGISTSHLAWRNTHGNVLIGHTAIGASTTRMHIRGNSTGTGSLIYAEDSGGTEKFDLHDNGSLYVAGAVTLGSTLDVSNNFATQGSVAMSIGIDGSNLYRRKIEFTPQTANGSSGNIDYNIFLNDVITNSVVLVKVIVVGVSSDGVKAYTKEMRATFRKPGISDHVQVGSTVTIDEQSNDLTSPSATLSATTDFMRISYNSGTGAPTLQWTTFTELTYSTY